MRGEIKRKSLLKEQVSNEGAIKGNEVLKVINEALDVYKAHDKNILEKIEAMNEFKEKTKKWDVITIYMNEKRRWIQSPFPFEYYEEIESFSLTSRFLGLLKTTKLPPKEVYRRHLTFEANLQFPLVFSVTSYAYSKYSRDNLVKFFLTLSFLKAKVEESMKKGFNDNIGIYERPYAVISMNVGKYYFDEMKRVLIVDDKGASDSIEVRPFHDLISHSEMVLPMG